jgi:hypothetical protein
MSFTVEEAKRVIDRMTYVLAKYQSFVINSLNSGKYVSKICSLVSEKNT